MAATLFVRLDSSTGNIRPNQFHQLLFLNQVTAALHQRNQGLENLGSQRHRFPVTQEKLLCSVQTVRTELI
jgi:hypothetical protein